VNFCLKKDAFFAQLRPCGRVGFVLLGRVFFRLAQRLEDNFADLQFPHLTGWTRADMKADPAFGGAIHPDHADFFGVEPHLHAVALDPG
jgi:hypothetical protein